MKISKKDWPQLSPLLCMRIEKDLIAKEMNVCVATVDKYVNILKNYWQSQYNKAG